ncbi:hypothetical protein Acsp06_63580 [Actinomycetospora sp. NBRC 106375]|uniref:hypothetical protein n=1 Tax=Actinomycetospora sp. NBRC 106375 TaxID=3032207 RepID=UPI0024A5CF3E|nr:hypothetical protein [Actinomycetospora sp. NBRC 106375]GLZ50173.1 hypothetical protein Acsp06_63580 [Actinomycetospora sp. NBRC 106375]
MDIGPVRQRFTAEPISSPVPGEESWSPEQVPETRLDAATDRVPVPETPAAPSR